MGNEISLPSTSKSYLALGSYSISSHLPLYAKINTNGKWIFLLIELKHVQVERILINAWTNHKMANILVFSLDKRLKLFVTSFNPFKKQGNNYGTFWSMQINKEKFSTILKAVENIFENKISNLQEYPLKGIFFRKEDYLDEIMVDIFQKAFNVNDMGNEISLPSTSKSYLALGSYSISSHLPLYAKINTNGKWIFLLIELKHIQVERILINAWNNHKMANILVLSLDERLRLFVTSYNPFKKQGNNYGTFWSMLINHENLSTILKKVENIFENKISYLQEYPLKGVRSGDLTEFHKNLNELMKEIFQKALNMKFKTVAPRDGKRIGTRLPNGSFTGVLKDIEDGAVDIGLNNKLLVPMNFTNCTFLNPVVTSDFRYLTSKKSPATTYLFYNVLQAYDLETRWMYLVCLIITLFCWYFLDFIHYQSINVSKREEIGSLLMIFIAIQTSSTLSVKDNGPSHQRILVGSLLIVSLIMCNAFQGEILRNLRSPQKSPDINSLEDLLQSDYKLTAFIAVPDLFQPDENDSNVNQIQKRLYYRQNISLNISNLGCKPLMRNPKQAFLMRGELAKSFLNVEINNATGEDFCHIVKESPISFFLTYIVPKTSPFIRRLNRAIAEAKEFGFIEIAKKKTDAILKQRQAKRLKVLLKAVQNHPPISIENLKNYLVDQESLTIFDTGKSKNVFKYKSQFLSIFHSILPCITYRNLNDSLVRKISDMGNEISLPSTSKSYLALGSYSISSHLPLYAKINTNGKWIFLLIELKHIQVERILINAWTNHKMANILVFSLDKRLKLFVTSFNPFKKQGNDYGTFWSMQINNENLSMILKVVENIFENKISNLQDYPLKGVFFREDDCLDNIIVGIFQKALNVKYEIVLPRDGDTIGTRLPNGSFTGELKDIEDGAADIGLDNRLLVPMNSSNCAFLNPVVVTEMKYITSKKFPPPTQIFHFVLQAYDLETRWIYFCCTILTLLSWYFLDFIHHQLKAVEKREEIGKLLLIITAIQVSSTAYIRDNIPSYQRILIGSLLIVSLIMCNAFEGEILRNLRSPQKSPDINSLEDLLQSDYKLTAFIAVPDLFQPDENDSNVNQIQKRLYYRQTVLMSFATAVCKTIVENPKQAFLMREEFVKELLNVEINNATGEDFCHIVKESPISFFLTYIVPKTSPFIRRLNRAIAEAKEFGFIEIAKKKTDAILKQRQAKRLKVLLKAVQNHPPISIENLKNVLIFYGMRGELAKSFLNVEINNATGEDFCHIVKESPISFFLTYIVPKTSPFIRRLNRAIAEAKEFGFIVKAKRTFDALNELRLVKRLIVVSENIQDHPPISVENLKKCEKRIDK
ncbi:CLUMA_CG020672, isoform A [Clunio marinus]|uniref:CLUMA_CG020672, isoform A n=1 Tax=Clunio marinus TaxID=568069 RepID=A0A1J1J8B3_9DIPT|nr:CLUMA_CG020672, isoform A [Clunio marinus]